MTRSVRKSRKSMKFIRGGGLMKKTKSLRLKSRRQRQSGSEKLSKKKKSRKVSKKIKYSRRKQLGGAAGPDSLVVELDESGENAILTLKFPPPIPELGILLRHPTKHSPDPDPNSKLYLKKSLIKRINTKLQLQGKSISAETYGIYDKPYKGINLVASEEKKNFTIVAVGNFKNPNILTNEFTKEALSNITKRHEDGFSISFEKDVLNHTGNNSMYKNETEV